MSKPAGSDGSGIARADLLAAFRRGIAKINIGTTIRQAYEAGLADSPDAAAGRACDATTELLTTELDMAGSAGGNRPDAVTPRPAGRRSRRPWT